MKISIIAEGGGMRGAFVLGVIDALYSHFGLKSVDVAVGVSASAGTLAYYAAGQFYPGYHIWKQELISKKFISFKNVLQGRPLMDVDYVIDEVFKKHIPLNIDNLHTSTTKLIVPLHNLQTNRVDYIDTQETPLPLWEVLRASLSAPVACNRVVTIGNVPYVDPHFILPIPISCEAISDTTKIIILAKPPNYRPGKIYSMAVSPYSKYFCRKEVHQHIKKEYICRRKLVDDIFSNKANNDVIIWPENIHATLDNSLEALDSSIQHGYTTAVNHVDLQHLLKQM